ncbi:MAG: gluconokinase [Actinomycetota bacterium]|nr:gluconokinase [Actinomycetota bacterium]
MSHQPSTPDAPRHLVVMGVSGVGKSTVAELLRARLGFELAEGDDFHPPANVEKMSAGVPLQDADRWPWLRALADWARERHADGRSTVMTCSALKRDYRDVLREGVPNTFFVHLVGNPSLLLERMARRRHFMPPSLLESQFETLQRLDAGEDGMEVEVTATPDEIVEKVVQELGLP